MNRFRNKKILATVVTSLVIAAPLLAQADTLTRQLESGMRGADVASLQTYLATDATLYPQGLVTGYFGFLTKSAVSNFQSANGLPAVGRVGPATLPVINAKMAGGVTSNSASAPIIMGLSTTVARDSATVAWSTNENAKGVVYYSVSPLTTYERPNSVDVSGSTAMTDANFKGAQSVVISGLQANTTYYYMVYTTDANGNVSVTVPSAFRTAN